MFWASCGSGVGGGWGCPHTCAHARTCMHGKHDNFMQMAAPLGESLGIPYDVIHTCACMHMHECAHVWGHPLTTPTPIHPPPTPPRDDPRNHSKFDSTSTNRDISIPFEDLKSVETSPPMGGCMVWWVGGWMGWLMGGIRSKH